MIIASRGCASNDLSKRSISLRQVFVSPNRHTQMVLLLLVPLVLSRQIRLLTVSLGVTSNLISDCQLDALTAGRLIAITASP